MHCESFLHLSAFPIPTSEFHLPHPTIRIRIKLIISTLQRCQSAKVAVRVVTSPKQGEELKSFQETGGIPTVDTNEETRARFAEHTNRIESVTVKNLFAK